MFFASISLTVRIATTESVAMMMGAFQCVCVCVSAVQWPMTVRVDVSVCVC